MSESLLSLKPRKRRYAKSRRFRGSLDMSDGAKTERAYSAALWGDPLNGEMYDPRDNQLVPANGAWVMVKRQLPPMERNLDEVVSVGRIFWAERPADADEDGFRSDGTYKVLCRTPFGDVCLWPYEYAVLDPLFITQMWQEEALTFHPIALSDNQLSDQLFYLRSRGIGLADAAVMALGSLTGANLGWFEPTKEIADFVAMFQDVGRGLTDVNRKRRADAKLKTRNATKGGA